MARKKPPGKGLNLIAVSPKHFALGTRRHVLVIHRVVVSIQQGLGAAQHGWNQRQFAVFAGATVLVKEQKGCTHGWGAERGGNLGLHSCPAQVSATDFGAATVLDDRFVARLLHEPLHFAGIRGLPRGRKAPNG